MALSTASNWIWNFLIAFFTPFITSAIDFRYGYVFAACCAAASLTVYFFLLEAQGKTLEEVDEIYILHIKPWKSKGWTSADNERRLSSVGGPRAGQDGLGHAEDKDVVS